MGMMERIEQPDEREIDRLLARPDLGTEAIADTVTQIIATVRKQGDAALLSYTETFDGVLLDSVTIPMKTIKTMGASLDPKLKEAIARARDNIKRFHEAQKPEDERVETEPGVYCWRRSVPIQSVGIYVPGGSAPLFSTVLMLAVPAQIAGCGKIILATPPRKDGTIDPAICYAAILCGVTQVVAVGGAQAIAALAYGTESVPAVDKIFGPGNRFVTEAKQQVGGRVCAIDMPAGPSEVMVVIDTSSKPSFAAADLLSQAEHGPDSQVVLVVHASTVPEGHTIIDAVEKELVDQMENLKRKGQVEAAMRYAKAVIVTSLEQCSMVVNHYAPEHLILNLADFVEVDSCVRNAGSVFLGQWACESAGDYASGTNHTLPTAGWARSQSGVSLDSFYKKITFQRITQKGLQSLGPTIETMARAESLDAHAHAVRVRLEAIEKEES